MTPLHCHSLTGSPVVPPQYFSLVTETLMFIKFCSKDMLVQLHQNSHIIKKLDKV